MNPYPIVSDDKNATLKKVLEVISRERKNDVNDYNGLPQRFIGGRRVQFIPSSSTDTTTSALGDFNVTIDHAYFCVDAGSGTVKWVRVGVSTF